VAANELRRAIQRNEIRKVALLLKQHAQLDLVNFALEGQGRPMEWVLRKIEAKRDDDNNDGSKYHSNNKSDITMAISLLSELLKYSPSRKFVKDKCDELKRIENKTEAERQLFSLFKTYRNY